jgi:hypothetical protein
MQHSRQNAWADAQRDLSAEKSVRIVEVSWNIRYDIKKITANRARQTTFMKGTGFSLAL